ncbi:hypothetical protein [Tropicibacter alexandrii]|uniref:hypothetical protein n=1 Tax=Tropicibacter alexandrii TaxID=2267683 RepID=UPI001F0BC7F0|nr:hypothetical protein [Tropicibacter alexandrii]
MLDLVLIIIALGVGVAGGGADAPRSADVQPRMGGEEAPPGYQPPVQEAPAPLPYAAEQQVATGRFLTALEVKPILQATRPSWLAVREFDGKDLVYVTQLWSWRCGLVAIHFGVNGEALQPWPLPACHEDTNAPNAILPEDGLPYREYPLGHVQTMTVELVYDDLTTDRATYDRRGAMIP